MLPDPISVTYDSVAKSMPRTSPKSGGFVKLLGTSGFNTADGEFHVTMKRSEIRKNGRRVEVILTRVSPDTDGPFVGNNPDTENSFGVIYETNGLNVNSSVDIPKLRTALLAFLDSTTQSRILSGEF